MMSGSYDNTQHVYVVTVTVVRCLMHVSLKDYLVHWLLLLSIICQMGLSAVYICALHLWWPVKQDPRGLLHLTPKSHHEPLS